jgi:DNA-directed RNA polymerase subunit L
MSTEKSERRKIDITIENEDHTLGNIMQEYLLSHNSIIFAAYNVPHPLEKKLKISYIAKNSEESKKIFIDSIDNAINDTLKIKEEFMKSIK